MRNASLQLLALLALGCAPAAPTTDECVNAPVLDAPASGCTVVGLEVAGEDTCTINGVQTVTGSWVELRHPADRSATLSLRVLSMPDGCDASGARCPTAHVTQGGVPPCSCAVEGGLDSFTLPTTTTFELPLLAPQQAVLLRPAGAIYEVSICVNDDEPFPTCGADGSCFALGSVTASGNCACLPSCRVDDDCPQPRTGTIRARCEPIGCTLPCGVDDACPAAQSCVDRGGANGPICMAPL
jgi:hypothetical protein